MKRVPPFCKLRSVGKFSGIPSPECCPSQSDRHWSGKSNSTLGRARTTLLPRPFPNGESSGSSLFYGAKMKHEVVVYRKPRSPAAGFSSFLSRSDSPSSAPIICSGQVRCTCGRVTCNLGVRRAPETRRLDLSRGSWPSICILYGQVRGTVSRGSMLNVPVRA